MNIIKNTLELLSYKDKKKLVYLILFALLISIIETIGISVIMPFLSVLSDVSIIDTNKYYHYIYTFFSFESKDNFIIIFGITLILFYFFRGGMNLLYVHVMAKFNQYVYLRIANKLFYNFFHIDYLTFTKLNTSKLNKTIINETTNMLNSIAAMLMILSEVLVIVLIYSILFFTDWSITVVLSIFLAFNGLFMYKVLTKRIKSSGNKREMWQKKYYEIINKTFGNFKLLKLHQDNLRVEDEFYKATKGYINANIYYATWSPFPRIYLEVVGFSIIITIVVFLVWKDGAEFSHIIPTISVFILALYRLMPSANRIMTAMNTIAFYSKSINEIHRDLNISSEELHNQRIKFNHYIELQNIYFAYDGASKLLENINLKIYKGTKIAFIGESGSGKSTLVDIIMGLLPQSSGNIYIDNTLLTTKNIKCWRHKIGYIPQDIYLFDGTIKDNIVLGSEFDNQKVDKILKQVNIYDFLYSKEGLSTHVGEGGIQLSGGQKQRIAIARALYHNPEILILDEATSALDTEIEAVIMEEIYKVSQDKTLIIIAHRLSTIQKCDVVYEVKKGQIVEAK
jgi:ABC-type multidrug transport system fused ATPase/permease subunit